MRHELFANNQLRATRSRARRLAGLPTFSVPTWAFSNSVMAKKGHQRRNPPSMASLGRVAWPLPVCAASRRRACRLSSCSPSLPAYLRRKARRYVGPHQLPLGSVSLRGKAADDTIGTNWGAGAVRWRAGPRRMPVSRSPREEVGFHVEGVSDRRRRAVGCAAEAISTVVVQRPRICLSAAHVRGAIDTDPWTCFLRFRFKCCKPPLARRPRASCHPGACNDCASTPGP
ncbi:hypothetical protein BDY21DRAFT_348965 [Lineolata rhizophorae]|uniref:Uncharacterized protein n=1 Tax=Lineolata rhizophorae TaxID=578093 RepID=A0A6A6NVY7_9PEZI|nr:hypothetical protein BDY21DRAFT_348965 [Lineolata rhizophorae]